MKRWHLFEFEDQSWLPYRMRSLITDLLQYQLMTFNLYEPVIPHLKKMMQAVGCKRLIDLCSGSGGPMLQIQEKLGHEFPISITLTDKYPNIEALKRISDLSPYIDFYTESVDATQVPNDLKGVRTLFTSFHHFQADKAREVIADAVKCNTAIGIFEFTERRLFNIIGTFLLTPFHVLLETPFVRPFHWNRIFWTYIIPVSPLICMWDGMASNFRTYTIAELQSLSSGLNDEEYIWEIDQLKSVLGIRITYLLGYPKNQTI